MSQDPQNNKAPDLSLFFPAHNEEGNLAGLLADTAEFAKTYDGSIEAIVIDDGSSDATEEVLKTLSRQYPFLRSIRHEKNRGYGGALRTGFHEARGEWVFFTDGDRQFRVQDLSEFFEKLKKEEQCDGVIGFRANRQDHLLRKLNTFLWCSLVGLLLGIRFRDVDCAFKLMRRSLISDIEFTTTGAMISTELLYHLQKKQAKLIELGVKHHPREHGEASGANPQVILRAFKELFSFFINERLRS